MPCQRRARGETGSPRVAPEFLTRAVLPMVRQVSRSPHLPLDPETGRVVEARFGHDFSRVQAHAPVPSQLVVSPADDPLEREANTVAERVVHEAAAPLRAPSTGAADTPVVTPSVAARLASSAMRGAPLPEAERTFFEPAIGRSLDDVRVHADGEAATLADALGAEAFTHGRDVYFAAGRYAPQATSGRRLLAHELAHVAQQAVPGSPVGIQRKPADDAKALAKQVHAALTVTPIDKTALFKALGSPGRDATKVTALKTVYKTEYGTELEADLASALKGDDLAQARFLLNAPPPDTGTHAEVTVDKAGTEAHKVKAGGGEVSVRTDVDFTAGGAKYPGGYSVGYSGTGSSDARFIQFLWSEIVATQPDKTDAFVDKKGLGTSNGTMDLTIDPTKPKYKVDSGSSSSPFYEAGFTDVRTSTGTTIYDRPSEFADVIAKQFDAKATQVVERDHFDVFLVTGYKTVYQVSLVVQWTYTSKTAVKRTTKFSSGSAVTALPKDVKAALVKEYPKFDYVQ